MHFKAKLMRNIIRRTSRRQHNYIMHTYSYLGCNTYVIVLMVYSNNYFTLRWVGVN